MGYFRELPNLEYQSFLSESRASDNYLLVKNLFRRVKLRDDLQNVFTVFNKYQIPDGSRPELVANELYGSEQYDWVVIVSAGITRVRDEWPLSNKQLYDYALEKYGLQDLNATKFYETTEVKDNMGRLIMPAGKVVDQGFTIQDPDNENLTLNPVIGVTNYLDETRNNENKRNISILRRQFLTQFMTDLKTSVRYNKSSDYIDRDTKRTYNQDTKGL